jgi:hypothetical protein
VDDPLKQIQPSPQLAMSRDTPAHPLLAKLANFPNHPRTVVLRGYLGESGGEFVRLYRKLDMRSYVDVPTRDILYVEPPDPSNLFRPTRVLALMSPGLVAGDNERSLPGDAHRAVGRWKRPGWLRSPKRRAFPGTKQRERFHHHPASLSWKRLFPPQLATLRSIAVPGKPPYPLNAPIRYEVRSEGRFVTVRLICPDLDDEVIGRGPNLHSATDDLGRRFDRLVQRNRAIPPHAMTPENQRMARILDRLVDWQRYERDNPLVQPMWGQIRNRHEDGSLVVHWVTGPGEAQDQEATLRGWFVPPSLAEMELGAWFYGTAKCYPDCIDWIDEPHIVPDPHDEEANRRLWESLPRVPADQPGCWPLKTS